MASDSQSNASLYKENAPSPMRQAGAKRAKLAGYLRSANDIRQSYIQNWTRPETSPSRSSEDNDTVKAPAISTGDEQMILFPSYARHHNKQKVIPGRHASTIKY